MRKRAMKISEEHSRQCKQASAKTLEVETCLLFSKNSKEVSVTETKWAGDIIRDEVRDNLGPEHVQNLCHCKNPVFIVGKMGNKVWKRGMRWPDMPF